MKLHFFGLFFLGAFIMILSSCNEAKETTDDAVKVAALKNVTIEYDKIMYTFDFPEGALSGKSFAELYREDSATFANPANYGISIQTAMLADNTKENARDAKFDGMMLDIIMDTISGSPIRNEFNGFMVEKQEILPISSSTTINLATHRLTGLYIFRQTVDGNDLATTFSPVLSYQIGMLEGDIDVPDFRKDIPTRASEETKAFLRGLLESGIMELQETREE
jgi:hypothetical protein